MLKEFGRIAEATQFNGQRLLVGTTRGGVSSISFQLETDGSADSLLSINTSDTGRASGVIDLLSLQSAAPAAFFGFVSSKL